MAPSHSQAILNNWIPTALHVKPAAAMSQLIGIAGLSFENTMVVFSLDLILVFIEQPRCSGKKEKWPTCTIIEF